MAASWLFMPLLKNKTFRKTAITKTIGGFLLLFGFIQVIAGYNEINHLEARPDEFRYITSSNYPSSYDINTYDLNIIYSVKSGYRIVIDVLMFNLEYSAGCYKDYVSVYDGLVDGGRKHGKYCGSTIPSKLISTNKQASFIFKSDSFRSGSGFKIKYYATLIDHSVQKLIATDDAQYLKSPNYPLDYSNNLFITYVITSYNRKDRIAIEITDLELDADCNDKLTARDETELWSFCELDDSDKWYTSTYNLSIVFVTDSTSTNRGFKIKYFVSETDPSSNRTGNIIIGISVVTSAIFFVSFYRCYRNRQRRFVNRRKLTQFAYNQNGGNCRTFNCDPNYQGHQRAGPNHPNQQRAGLNHLNQHYNGNRVNQRNANQYPNPNPALQHMPQPILQPLSALDTKTHQPLNPVLTQPPPYSQSQGWTQPSTLNQQATLTWGNMSTTTGLTQPPTTSFQQGEVNPQQYVNRDPRTIEVQPPSYDELFSNTSTDNVPHEFNYIPPTQVVKPGPGS